MTTGFYENLSDTCHELLFENKDILGYLKNVRGLSDETISKYRLGAFPSDLRKLYGKKSKISAELLKEHNIIWNASQSQFKMYPLVIPIKNVSGVPIAIGCRTMLGEEERKEVGVPKYRNSVYKKTAHLFGLNHAINSIREKNAVFVVEGYFDVISAHQMGFNNVVATCGTIFSKRQLMILSRYSKNINLLFDNDVPGKRSAKRAMDNFFEFPGVSLSCKFTPDGFKDLDEYISSGNSPSFIV